MVDSVNPNLLMELFQLSRCVLAAGAYELSRAHHGLFWLDVSTRG